MGKARLDRGVALPQRVILSVGNLWLVLPVIGLVVVGDLARQALELGGSLLFAQSVDRLRPGLGSRSDLALTFRVAHAALFGSCRSRQSTARLPRGPRR